jgi:hypothetical protein
MFSKASLRASPFQNFVSLKTPTTKKAPNERLYNIYQNSPLGVGGLYRFGFHSHLLINQYTAAVFANNDLFALAYVRLALWRDLVKTTRT